MDPAGCALRNDTGSTRENPEDRTLLATGGSITIGTPAVPDGQLGTVPLEMSRQGGQLELRWGAIESNGLPVTYNVYRGSLDSLFATKTYDHGCFMSGLSSLSATFVDGGENSYFLVAAAVPGWGEGALTTDSSGLPHGAEGGAQCP
jgi:hypothetical protein